MPRVTGAQEQMAMWNNSNNAKFRSLAKRGNININDITLAFIESIRTKHGWENHSAENFRQSYQRVVNTLHLA
jgi:hypothetical protein